MIDSRVITAHVSQWFCLAVTFMAEYNSSLWWAAFITWCLATAHLLYRQLHNDPTHEDR